MHKQPRKPDYDVSAMRKLASIELKGRIGAAWANPDGTISVVLDPFTCVRQEGDLLITLFPRKKGLQSTPLPEGDEPAV